MDEVPRLTGAEGSKLVRVQEEPSNMGSWTFVAERLRRLAAGKDVHVVARGASASPAAGSAKVHEREEQELLHAAFA